MSSIACATPVQEVQQYGSARFNTQTVPLTAGETFKIGTNQHRVSFLILNTSGVTLQVAPTAATSLSAASSFPLAKGASLTIYTAAEVYITNPSGGAAELAYVEESN
jgi:hypothetical protein